MRSSLLPLALLGTAISSQEVDKRDLKDIYAAAREEGSATLRVFSGGDRGSSGLRDAWLEEFPDIPIVVTTDLSKYHDVRIDQGYAEKAPVADIAILQTVNDFPRWKQEGHLVEYKHANWSDVITAGKDKDGAYWPVGVNGFGTIAWDQTKCPNNTIPDSYADFVKPEWKGKLVLTWPNDDDAVAYLFAKNVPTLGYSWLEGLAANDVEWVRGTYTPQDHIRRYHNDTTSDRCLTFTSGAGSENWWASKAPADNQTMMWTQTGALLAGSSRPEAQKLFMNWLLTTTPAVSVSGRKANNQTDEEEVIAQTKPFADFMADRAAVERWRFTFEDKFGTAQGPNPNVVYPSPPN